MRNALGPAMAQIAQDATRYYLLGYSPTNTVLDGKFRRIEVTVGQTLANNMQEILSGIQPGQQVVRNALVFQNTVEQ